MSLGGGSSEYEEPPETAAERALAEVSAAKWSDYQKTFVPLQNEYMSQVDRLGDEQVQQGYGMMAGNMAMSQVAGTMNDANQSMFAQGIDPSSGVFKTKSRVLSQAMAQTQQNAFNQGKLAAENAHIQGLSNVAAIGNGQQTTAFNGMGSLASTAAQNAINESNREFTKYSADQQLKGQVLGSVAGAAANGYFKGSTSPDMGDFTPTRAPLTTGLQQQQQPIGMQNKGFGWLS